MLAVPVEAGILATAVWVGEGLLLLGPAGVLPLEKLRLLGPAGALAPAPLTRKKLLLLWKQRLTPALVQGVSEQPE